ncbi:uncharacterized protein KQ657_004364 [Scheffersomyces spartinae]|uniref:Alcohol acetyltransferase n=1 Tax=Scheffersomyces spartinae TaxID=45513 RepID=A0A9P8AK18_9ASCO|nr:uncharacterized protein KQ657_004364 [Scheffersomyces spartinae]KAG7194687.1 hypothetical protein KQ657_004364 [Scheffersomyces spartinae]
MRQTTGLEDYYIYRNKLKLSTCVSVGGTYGLPIFGDKNLVFQVLKELIHENSPLRTNYKEVDGVEKWQLDPVKTILYDDVVKPCPYTECSAEFLEWSHSLENRLEIGSYKPLWRLNILNDFTACFSYDHTAMDGISGMAFHSKFREAAEKYVNGDKNNQIDGSSLLYEDFQVTRCEKKMPNGELLHNFNPPILTKVSMLWLILVNPSIQKLLGRAHASVPKTEYKSDTKVEIINIDSETLKAIQLRCKEENVRLVCWIITCLQLVLKEFLPKNQSLQGNIPINVRPLIKDIGTPLGLYVCGFTIPLEALDFKGDETQTILKQAQKRSIEVDGVLNDDCRYPIYSIGLLRAIPSIKNYLEKGITQDRETALECSNLGLFKQPKDSVLRVQDLIFSNADFVNGSAFAAYCVSTEEGGLNICLVNNKEYYKHVNTVSEELIKVLKSIIN